MSYYSKYYLKDCGEYNVKSFDLLCESPELLETFPCCHMFTSLTTESVLFLVICASNISYIYVLYDDSMLMFYSGGYNQYVTKSGYVVLFSTNLHYNHVEWFRT